MLRIGGGTISAKTGLLHAGAGQAMKTPITVSTAPYMVTTLGYDNDGSTCGGHEVTTKRITDFPEPSVFSVGMKLGTTALAALSPWYGVKLGTNKILGCNINQVSIATTVLELHFVSVMMIAPCT